MELRDYFRILRAHWLGVLLLSVLGIGVAFGWTLVQPRVYTADATGYVTPYREDDASGAGVASMGEQLARSKVLSFVDIGNWRSVAQYAIDDLQLDTTPETLVRQVSVTNPLDTVILQVTAQASSPEAARDLAEAWVAGLAVEVEKLETDGGTVPPTVNLVPGESAQLPTGPSSPNTRLALAIGLLAGLAAGIAYAVSRYVFDRRVRSAEAVERETGLSVVGTIPEEKTFTADNRLIPFDGGNTASSKNAHLYAVSEAVRELRTNIQYLDVDNPPRSIVITSALPGEGKSTTSANLAITLAASGQRVVLIDGDLRRPMVASVFSLIGGAGLTDVLAGRATFADVAQPIGPAGRLHVLGSGKIPPNPSEILGSQRMRDLIAELSTDAVVIIDAPPVIPVTDATVLTRATDGAIVVTTVGKTTLDALSKAQQNLSKAGGRILGVVLNRVPRRGAGAAYYGYQYTGSYYRADEATTEAEPVETIERRSARRAARR